MSNLFNHVRAEMQRALDSTIKFKPIVERLHNTMAAACGLSNNCDSKTIIAKAEAESIIGMEYHWIKPIYDEYIFITNNTLDAYEFDIINNLLKELERLEKNAWLGKFDNAFNTQPFNNSDTLNQIFENNSIEQIPIDPIFNKPEPEPIFTEPVFTDNVSVETIESEIHGKPISDQPSDEIVETVEEPKPKKYNWEHLIERDRFGEYIWITWEKIIPKNKYKLYRNGKIINSIDNSALRIHETTHMFKLSSTMCTQGDKTSAINKFRNLNYYAFIQDIEKKYPGFLVAEIIQKVTEYKNSRKTKRNGVRRTDRIDLSSMFQTTLYPIPEGGHYRQLDGKQFGLIGCYAINKYGHVVNRESKVVTNAVDRKGVKCITIEGKEFEFNKLMLGAFRIDDPKTKEIEQEFIMRNTMISIDWIEGVPSEKYIYIKGKGVYNTVLETFIKTVEYGGKEHYNFTSTMRKPHMEKGARKTGQPKEAPKKITINCEAFIAEAEKRMKLRDDNNNINNN